MKRRFLHMAVAMATVVMVSVTACKKEEAKKEDTNTNTNNNNNANFLAPTTPMNRVAVLEDYTGVRCGFCPDGHVRANAIEATHGDKFITIANHAGYYAKPAAGWMNFTTIGGDALDAYVSPAGYPAGSMNRMLSTELGVTAMGKTNYSLGRGEWSKAATKVLTMSAPVNLGATATYDATAKTVKVHVDIYYTADEAGANNLTVAILQDGIPSKQSGATGTYIQNHVLRQQMTPLWGDVLGTGNKATTKISKDYEVMIPDYYGGSGADGGGAAVIDKMKVVAFVTRDKMDILNAVEVDIK